jgi:hypothetical protein
MATELWNEGDPQAASQEGPGARFLRRHVLELPIHQDIREDQIRYMAQQVVELNVALERTSGEVEKPAGRPEAHANRTTRRALSVGSLS